MEYSDNLQLLSSNPQGTAGTVVNAGMDLKRAGEQGYLSIIPALRFSRYDSSDPLDSNDEMLTGAWSRSGERGKWLIDGEWTHDSTLTSELQVSGLVQTAIRRLLRSLSPSYSFAVSPRSTLAADVSYTAVKYVNASTTGLVDYNNASSDLSWSYQWSERATITGRVYGSRYESALVGDSIHTTGGELQLSSSLTEHWDGVFSAGIYRSTSNGRLGKLDLTRKDEVGQWSLGMSQTVEPSGAGVLVQQDVWSVAREQKLSPLWHISATGSWVVNKDLQSVAATRDRHYRSAALSLSRILTPAWHMEASYTHDHQEFAGGAGRAERNTIMLGIHFSGNE